MKKKLRSLDYTYQRDCDLVPYNEGTVLLNHKKYAIRGSGTSIACTSFGSNTQVLELNKSTPILELDIEKKTLIVSADKTLFELYEYLTPKGLYLKSVPSHPSAKIGGCIAYNAHGQNHERDGCFCDHLLEMKLFHPQHGSMTLSSEKNQDVYELTVNGFGLTGIILSAKIKVYPLSSNSVSVARITFNTLQESYQLFMKYKGQYDFYRSWIELNYISYERQVGFLEMAKIKNNNSFHREKIKHDYQPHLHKKFPINVFGTPLMRIISRMYYLVKARNTHKEMSLFQFMHPSANKMNYFSMFGKQGLIEHQILIPHKNVLSYLEDFVKLICFHKPIISLCHSKLFGKDGKGMSFSGHGYCLTVHVPNDPKHLTFLDRIDQLDIKYNCKSNIVKDSRLSKNTIQIQYGECLELFIKKLLHFDPDRKFSNRISEEIYGI